MTRKTAYFVREIWKIALSITFVMGMIVASLYLLKMVPSYLQESEEKSYNNIEEAEYTLGLRVFLPSYFPEYLIWPPSEIKVVRKPSLTISLVFLSRSHRNPSLVLHQIFPSINEVESSLTELKKPLQETKVSVGGVNGTLIIGMGEDGKRWTQLSWKAADRRMVLIANFSVEDLLKIARSIH